MNIDLEFLRTWILWCLIVSAICTTSFPFLWAFSKWYSTLAGRLFMLQAVAFAFAIDVTLVFQFWPPNPENVALLFWMNSVIFGLISVSSFWLTFTMVRVNYFRKKKEKKNVE